MVELNINMQKFSSFISGVSSLAIMPAGGVEYIAFDNISDVDKLTQDWHKIGGDFSRALLVMAEENDQEKSKQKSGQKIVK